MWRGRMTCRKIEALWQQCDTIAAQRNNTLHLSYNVAEKNFRLRMWWKTDGPHRQFVGSECSASRFPSKIDTGVSEEANARAQTAGWTSDMVIRASMTINYGYLTVWWVVYVAHKSLQWTPAGCNCVYLIAKRETEDWHTLHDLLNVVVIAVHCSSYHESNFS